MVHLNHIRDYMTRGFQEDSKVRSVQAEGETLEDALTQAAVELGLSIKKLEYEILTRGDKGFFGVGKKTWLVRAYELSERVEIATAVEKGGHEERPAPFDEERVIDRDGEVFVRLTQEGVFLKATRPSGEGVPATERMALEAVRNRSVTDFDSVLVTKIVDRADDQYVRIGSYDYNPANDALMTVEIDDSDMRAYAQVKRPGPGGTDLTSENMVSILQNLGVSYGIMEDVLKSFEDRPVYQERILVAEGTPPANGKDARVIYSFNTVSKMPTLKEKDGKIDFKELNLVENVVAGQILAKKEPPGKGEDGQTVSGKILPSKAGRDTEIQIGKNVKLAEERTTAISEINGQVLLVSGKINVEPIYTVQDDVNLHTGNILFLGTVIVQGNVEDGFSVKASGNIEVMGNVGKCELDAEGDIIIHQGILGKNGGKVKTGRSVFAKFIEHAQIEAGEYVVANEGIIHSFVDANKKIICQGKRASVVGGRMRAAEEVNAKNLGSVAGTETIIEAGYDPKSKERLVELEGTNQERMKEIEEFELNIKTLENLKKVQKNLPEEKETYLNELKEKRSEVLAAIEEINKEMQDIKYRLNSIKQEGKIGASEKVFPGVRIFIKDAGLDVRQEFNNVTFILEKNNVKMTKYEPIEEEIRKSRV